MYDATQGTKELLAREKVAAYVGFDPTAPGLHAGSLMQVMALARLQRAGHSPIAVVGGGTGMIGDPSGKTVERTLQSREVVEANVRGIRAELERFLDFEAPTNPARLVDNGEWLNSMSAMEFLRDVGKYFTVNYLLAKESVKRRSRARKGSRTPNSATRCCRRTTFWCCTIGSTAGCRWAAATSGGTSSAGDRLSSASCGARRPTDSSRRCS